MLPANFSVTQSLQSGFSTLLNYIPRLIGALIILIIGYFIAKVIGKLVTKLLEKVGFDQMMDRADITQYLARSGTNLTPSSLLGKVVFWFVFIIVLVMFASALGVPQIADFLNRMIAYIPNVFAAIVIIFLGMLLAKFISGIVRGITGSEPLAKLTNIVIIVYAVFMALVQLHIAAALTGPTFLIILGGISLAVGLSFGLGGRDFARSSIERFAASTQQPAQHAQGGPEQPPEGGQPYDQSQG